MPFGCGVLSKSYTNSITYDVSIDFLVIHLLFRRLQPAPITQMLIGEMEHRVTSPSGMAQTGLILTLLLVCTLFLLPARVLTTFLIARVTARLL